MAMSKPTIDHGWAWMIVAGNCLSAFFMSGLARSFGVFFQPLIETFDSSATVVSTITTARMVTAMISVLVAPVLSERFSERKVVMTGSVIVCCSYIIVYLADNISYCIVYSALAGVGQGFILVPSQAILGKYFQKRRSLAASISSTGASIGQIVLPPFCVWLMQEFTVRGTFLILGAMSLHVAVTGALQRPIDLTAMKTQTPIECVENVSDTELKDEEQKIILTRVDVDDDDDDATADVTVNTMTETPARTDELYIHGANSHTDNKVVSEEDGHQGIQPSFGTRLCNVITTQLDLKLFAVPAFLVFIILVGCTFGFYRPFQLFIVPSATEDGIPDQQASLLLTIGAITDICSRMLLGYLADLRIIKPYQVLAIGGISAGIFMCLFPLADQYWSMMLICALIGLTSEVRVYLSMPIVVDLVGVSRMPVAIGWIAFIVTLSQAAVVPLFGYIRDASGSYELTFYLCGAFIITMSAGIFSLVFLEKRTLTTKPTPVTKREEIAQNVTHAASVESLAM